MREHQLLLPAPARADAAPTDPDAKAAYVAFRDKALAASPTRPYLSNPP